jgi:hypothetical protein
MNNIVNASEKDRNVKSGAEERYECHNSLTVAFLVRRESSVAAAASRLSLNGTYFVGNIML